MYKQWYSHFLKNHPGVQHFACHSHHYWPDITREAHLQYWEDSAKYVDDKWGHFFSEIIPQAQKLVADILQLSKPERITWAPNTHELVFRVLSSLFSAQKKIKVLTTDSEFHSFNRQIHRLQEAGFVECTFIPQLPIETFPERFLKVALSTSFDFVFFSHVFFNSGLVADIEQILTSLEKTSSILFVDGYHSFMALPTNLSKFEHRIYYVAGGYKYAQGGEGACFLYSPPSANDLFPVNTGWFAELDLLGGTQKSKVGYSQSHLRFSGSTMDFSALYRLKATLELFKQNNLSVELIHSHVQMCQKKFIEHISTLDHYLLTEKNILISDLHNHGHFLTFVLNTEEDCKQLCDFLKGNKIITDYRSNRLRFGFAIYHDGLYDLSCIKHFKKNKN